MTPRLSDDARHPLAQHYWRTIDEAAAAWWSEYPDDPSGGPRVQDLITEAILKGITSQLVDVGDGVKVPLSELLACFRTRPGGLAQSNEAERSRVLNRPYGGPKWEGW